MSLLCLKLCPGSRFPQSDSPSASPGLRGPRDPGLFSPFTAATLGPSCTLRGLGALLSQGLVLPVLLECSSRRQHMANFSALLSLGSAVPFPMRRALTTPLKLVAPLPSWFSILLTMLYFFSCLQQVPASNTPWGSHIIALFMLSPHGNLSSAGLRFSVSFSH